MHNHWDKHLKVKDLVLEYKPTHIVELGAGSGDNTSQYLKLIEEIDYDVWLTVISDGACPDYLRDEAALWWIFGVAHIELKNLHKDSIDFCSIDTDHNWWTLNEEIKALRKPLKKGGILVIHDTESYKTESGKMTGYNCGHSYPTKRIEKNESKGMADAMYEAVERGEYKIIRQVKASAGATALMKLK